MKQRIAVLFGVLLALGLVLAGCGNTITPEEIVAKVQETAENTDNAHAVVSVSINAQGIEMSARAEMWEKAPNKVRAEVLSASEPRFDGMVMVSDGQQTWLYEPASDRVTVGPAGELEMPLPQEALTSLQETVQEVLDASEVDLVGEETVAGRDAYKLTLSPSDDAEGEMFPGDGTATLWVDKEQWIVLKAEYEANSFGQGTMEVESFELNPGLSDSLFHFEVPEGATVVDAETPPEPLTLEEAQAEFPLLVPGYVPQGATLIEVFRIGDSYVLRYNHSTEVSFAIVQGPDLAGPPPLGQSQDISVRGHEATVVTDEAGGNTFLYWTEDGSTVTVAGHISLDEALKVAESLQ